MSRGGSRPGNSCKYKPRDPILVWKDPRIRMRRAKVAWWELPSDGTMMGSEWLTLRGIYMRRLEKVEKNIEMKQANGAAAASGLARLYAQLADTFTPEENARMVRAMYATATGVDKDGRPVDHKNMVAAAEWIKNMLRDCHKFEKPDPGPQSVTNQLTVNLNDPEVLKAVLKMAQVRGLLPGTNPQPEIVDGAQEQAGRPDEGKDVGGP